MKEERSVTEISVEIFKAIEEWYATIPAGEGTIDNLIRHLTIAEVTFPFGPFGTLENGKDNESEEDDEEMPATDFAQRMNVQFLAQYLLSKKLAFGLTPLVVDAFLAPTKMYIGIEEMGYQFFLEHFHEHPMLVGKIWQGLGKPLRLRVQPVLPADDNIMAWFFDPWEMRVYILRARNSWGDWGEPVLNGPNEPNEKVKSISTFSVFAEYEGEDHPFSEAYRKRVEKFKKREPV